jgi:hypothetical protein
MAQQKSYRFKVLVSEHQLPAIKSEIERRGIARKGATFKALLVRMGEILAGSERSLGRVATPIAVSSAPVLLTCTVSEKHYAPIKRHLDRSPEPKKRLVFDALLSDLDEMLAGHPANLLVRMGVDGSSAIGAASNDDSIRAITKAPASADRESPKKPPNKAFAAAMKVDIGALRAATRK